MKDGMFEWIEKHVVYFLTGFVAVISSVLLISALYLFIIAPMIVFGNYYLLALPVISSVMYYLGRRIMKSLD